MASFNLPYTLSAEDTAVFTTLQGSALLPSLATPGEGELVQLFKQKQREEQRVRIEPYADLLEDKLLRFLSKEKDRIFKELKESKSTWFAAKLFSWNTVQYHESLTSLKARQAEMNSEERAAFSRSQSEMKELIKHNKWESTFGMMGSYSFVYGYDEDAEEEWTLHPQKVDNIFRHSDLALRLSLALGPNFFPSFQMEYKTGRGPHSKEGFSVYKKTLYVRYYPFGVSKQQMQKLLACAKSNAARLAEGKKTKVSPGEWAVGAEELRIQSAPPTLPPSPVPAAKSYEWDDMPLLPTSAPARCICGCEDESE